MSIVLDVRHKIKTQDIFRASTVRSLLAEYDAKAARVTELEAKLEQAREVVAPFADKEFGRIFGGNEEGEESIVYQRNFSTLKIRDFRRAAEWMKENE